MSASSVDVSKGLTSQQVSEVPTSKVIQDGVTIEINPEEIGVGDLMVGEEGLSIPSNGIIVHSNNFSLNELTLTGESKPVSKNKEEKKELRGVSFFQHSDSLQNVKETCHTNMLVYA